MEITLNDKNFQQEVLNSQGFVLVDFWASWCGPCMMLAPTIKEIAEENVGAVKVGKVNVDEAPGVANQFGVESIPTLILFKDGKPVKKSVGLVDKGTIERMWK